MDKAQDFLSLWEDQSLCDVELRTNNKKTISAHKVVLAAHSPFFRAIFAGASQCMLENKNSTVEMPPDVDDATLLALLKALYIGAGGEKESQRLLLDQVDVPKLLSAAYYLSIPVIVEMCCDYLMEMIELDTVVQILLLAEMHDCLSFYERAWEYLERNFGDLLRSKAANSIADLSFSHIKALMGSRSIQIYREADFICASMIWCLGSEDRMQKVGTLLRGTSRWYCHDDIECAASLVPQELLGDMNVQNLMKVINEALGKDDYFVSGEPRQDVSHEACKQSMMNDYSANGFLLVAGGLCDGWQGLKSVEIYDSSRDVWSTGPSLPHECLFADACALSSGDVYVAGHSTSVNLPSFFQYIVENASWEVMPGVPTQRVNAASTLLDDNMFVLGGRPTFGKDRHPSGLNECFRTGSRKWERLKPMNYPRASLDACSLMGRIWAVGGQSLQATHSNIEWYEPARDSWYVCNSAMPDSRKYTSVEVFAGSQILVIGGMDQHRTRLSSVLSYDPREGYWRNLAPLPSATSSASSCILKYDDLYVVGGRVAHDVETASVQIYSVRGGTWRQCSSMKTARSSSALARMHPCT
eukprot:jgi/Picsp_1/5106/NSC_02469-R1_kelch-like protein 8